MKVVLVSPIKFCKNLWVEHQFYFWSNFQASSDSAKSLILLKQESPQQLPHWAVHRRLNFLQEHNVWHSDFLQLQKIISKMNFGAICSTPWFGTILLPFIIHPHSNGSIELPHHSCIWKYTRYKCCLRADFVGGRDAKSISLLRLLLALMWLNFINRKLLMHWASLCAPYSLSVNNSPTLHSSSRSASFR